MPTHEESRALLASLIGSDGEVCWGSLSKDAPDLYAHLRAALDREAKLRSAGRALWFELINFACPGDGTCNCRTCSTIRAWNDALPLAKETPDVE